MSRDERPRSHRFSLVMPFSNTDARQQFFNVNYMQLRNSLPLKIVKSAFFVTFIWSLAAFLGELLYE